MMRALPVRTLIVRGRVMNAAGIRPFVPGVTVVVLIHCLLAFSISKDLGAASLLLGAAHCPLRAIR
jgi:hypothetical protein